MSGIGYPVRLVVLALLLVGSAGPAGAAEAASNAPTVVLVSIDGLRPDYVLAADAHSLRVPTLRRTVAEGTYADGVEGVIPTVTYPSHTTLVTGVPPAVHGIYANTTFDPLGRNGRGWFWYAEDIRVESLWTAASKVGLSTANVDWPVTVGAPITANIPEFWRAGTSDDAKLMRAVATPGLLADLEKDLGEYPNATDGSVEADERRARFAEEILTRKHPRLIAVHLIALDHIQHETGPFSPASVAILERLDGAVSSLYDTARRSTAGPVYLFVVSDHGFVSTSHHVDLAAAFRGAGLTSTDSNGKLVAWKAAIWSSSGSAAVVLRDPSDRATAEKVRSLLDSLRRNKANGIARILSSEELQARGGFPSASYLVALRPGWKVTDASGEGRSATAFGGTHGYLPEVAEMRAAFFVLGPDVPAGRDLGVIDMRDVAPTIAELLGIALPMAQGKVLLARRSAGSVPRDDRLSNVDSWLGAGGDSIEPDRGVEGHSDRTRPEPRPETASQSSVAALAARGPTR